MKSNKHGNDSLKEIITHSSFPQALSKLNIFIKSAKNGLVLTSNFWNQLGYENIIESDAWISKVHPEDVPLVKQNWEDFFQGRTPETVTEFRIIRADGEYEWVSSRCEAVERNPDGTVASYIGLDQTLSSIKALQRDIELTENLVNESLSEMLEIRAFTNQLSKTFSLENFWNTLLNLFLSTEPWNNCCFIRDLRTTPVICSWKRDKQNQPIPVSHVFPKSDLTLAIQQEIQTMNHPIVLQKLPTKLSQLYGFQSFKKKLNWFLVPLINNQEVLGMVIFSNQPNNPMPIETVRKIILLADNWQHPYQNHLRLIALEEKSHHDDLTMVLGRRGFHMKVEDWFLEKRPFILIILDIDKFKLFNDNFGHARGDQVILEVVNAIRLTIGTNQNIIGRFGGDEFMAAVEVAHIKEGCGIAESIRKGVETKPSKTSPGVTISLGVAHTEEQFPRFSDMLTKADSRLLQAKRCGRNRLIWMDEGMEELNSTFESFVPFLSTN